MARGGDHADSKKPASKKSKGFKSSNTQPFHPSNNTSFDPSTPDFKPASGKESSRWTPYRTPWTSAGTYTNPLRQMQDTVARLEQDMVSQRERASHELEQARSEFENARQDLVTKDEMEKMKLGMTFENLSAAEQGLLNKESLVFLQNAMRNDMQTMYGMIQTMQGQTKALEGENKKLLAAVRGRGQGELEAPEGRKMIEAAPVKQWEPALQEPANEEGYKPVSERGEQTDVQAAGFEEQHAAEPEIVHEENKLAVAKIKKSGGRKSKSSQPAEKLINRIHRLSTAMVTHSQIAAHSEASTNQSGPSNASPLPENSGTQYPSFSTWQPSAIRQLDPTYLTAPENHEETFTLDFLYEYLGSTQLTPGLYTSSPSSILGGRGFWLLSAIYDPFAPLIPGAHGAKMTPFFNDDVDADAYHNAAVFVAIDEDEGYKYMGTYTQPRYSDRMSHSEMIDHVPQRVKDYWTENLAAAKDGPEWLKQAVMEHLVPRPLYRGATRRQDGEPQVRDLEISKQLAVYGGELAKRGLEARAQLEALTEDDVAELWEKSEVDEPKGLRLWWEYLQCVGYDEELYHKLVGLDAALDVKESQLQAQIDQLRRRVAGSNIQIVESNESQLQAQIERLGLEVAEPKVKTAESKVKETDVERTNVEMPQVEKVAEFEEQETEKQVEPEQKPEVKSEETKAEKFTYNSTFVPRKKKN